MNICIYKTLHSIPEKIYIVFPTTQETFTEIDSILVNKASDNFQCLKLCRICSLITVKLY